MSTQTHPRYTARSPLELADFVVATLGDCPTDSVVAVAKRGTCLDAVLRLDDRAPVGQLAEVLTSLLGRNGHEQAILIGYGPAERVGRWTQLQDLLEDRGVSISDLLMVHGGHCTNLATGEQGAYSPGTTDLALDLALNMGTATLSPTPEPADTGELFPLIARARARLGDFTADLRTLGRAVTALQHNPLDRAAAADLLAALNHPDPDYLEAAMVGVSGALPSEGADFLTGTFPQGLDWHAVSQTEATLSTAVRMGPRSAAAGPLAILAYVSWLRGQGRQASQRLDLALSYHPQNFHARAVLALIDRTPVAHIASNRAQSWKSTH